MSSVHGRITLVRTFIPKIPTILKVFLRHTFAISPTSTKRDLKTELAVAVLRAFIDSSSLVSVSKQQHITLKDPGIKGPIWISKVKLNAPPEDDARRVLIDAIDNIKNRENQTDMSYKVPEVADISAEWTGYRAEVAAHERLPDVSEQEKYERLMAETKSDLVILYFHGGAYYLLDPCSHRECVGKLAKLTSARALSVRYRLAPQNPFPCALLDAFLSYLYLLSPPPGSFHAAVPPEKIVFAGDSAGGNLCLALLQLVLEINRSSPDLNVCFHGKSVRVAVPAGLALLSPWTDLTRSFPSTWNNHCFDYLSLPNPTQLCPPCEVWPTDPPRDELYCETSALCHPLVSVVLSNDWRGSPPVFICCGEEMLADEDMHIASMMAQQGVSVVWEQYEAMPHCFEIVFPELEVSKHCFESISKFFNIVHTNITTCGTWIAAKTGEQHDVNVETLTKFTHKQVQELLYNH